MDINDIFGTNPSRPEHPDYWKLSEIVLDLDGSMEEGLARGRNVDDIIGEKLAVVGDSYALVYLAIQRAMRIVGVSTLGELQENMDEVNRFAVIYMEGMLVGARFKEATR